MLWNSWRIGSNMKAFLTGTMMLLCLDHSKKQDTLRTLREEFVTQIIS
jgi:hypothetical protein